MSTLPSLQDQRHPRHGFISEGGVVEEAGPRHHGYPFESEHLLRVESVVQAQAVGERRESQVADETIFVFELVSQSGPGPVSLEIIALIFESRAIDAGKSMEGRIKHPAGICHTVHVSALVVVFETRQAMLPA